MSHPPDQSSPDAPVCPQRVDNPFQLLVESLDECALFLLDPTGVVASWNAGAERLTGYKAGEAVGRHCAFCYPTESLNAGDEPQRAVQQALTEGRVEVAGRCLRKDGTSFLATLALTALCDSSQNHIGVAAVLREDEQTYRRQIEDALQTSESRFRTLFEHAQVGIVLANEQSIYLDANTTVCQMLGYTRDELIGLHASDIVAQADVEHIEPALGEITSLSKHFREWQFRRKDGSEFPADVIATMLPDGTLLGVIRDISDRKRADDYREHLAAIVESSQDAIISRNLDGVVTSWNAGATAIFGYTADEMIGASLGRLFPADRRDEESAILESLRRGERVAHIETERRTRDGRLIDVSVVTSPVRDARGRLVGASTIARDVTAVKEHEREIARLSRLYAALSQINQAIVTTQTRDELFQRVCQVLVEDGGFRMAWIGWHESETHRLVPVATWGDESEYLQSVDVYADDRPEGRGPSGLAFRSGQPYICNDLVDNEISLPWRSEVERRGFQASAGFPIQVGGQMCGTLSVYADKRGFFQNKEVALLTEAAADISFALDNFARDEARRQAERTLRDEKLFSDTMIESMPGIVYFYDSQGRFLRWNHNFETVSGYCGEEIAAMHPRDFFSDEERPRVEQRIAEVFEKGESSVDAPFLAKDGTATPYYFTGRRVVLDDACLIGVGIDISERLRAETALREAEVRFHTLFEQTPVGVVVVDPATAAIVEWNEQAARQLGYTSPEFGALSVFQIEAAQTGEGISRRIETVLAEGRSQFETQHRTKSGEIRDVFVSERVIELSGRNVIHCVFVDITERTQAEAEREKRHRAEAADRIKSAFLATMSHELRTPLNSIIGFTGILLQGLAGPLNPEQDKQLGMVRSSARHLLALVNDVLDISKIEAGQFEIARSPFDLRRSIAKVLAIVEPQAQAKRLGMRVHLAPQLGEAVNDERRFEQILLNLLGNAVKFTEEGEIGLEAALIDDFKAPGAASGQPAIQLRVSDTGIGIRPEDLPILFQPFRQIDSGLSRTHEGTGLGLAICRRLATLMGGEIGVESEWEKGSVFSVTLPIEGPVTS